MGISVEQHEDVKGNLVKDEEDNLKTLKEHINKNYENADVSLSAANTLYATKMEGKVYFNQLNPETLNQNYYYTNYIGIDNPKNIMETLIIRLHLLNLKKLHLYTTKIILNQELLELKVYFQMKKLQLQIKNL